MLEGKLVLLFLINHFVISHCLQGRQTRQNSGGVADLTKGGVTNFLKFLRNKNINFLEFLR